MPWPPATGVPLPSADRAFGIRENLADYCLNADHEIGGAKAQRFRQVLGIDIADVEYLTEAFRAGVLATPLSEVRDNAPFGVLCEVRIVVAGLHEQSERVCVVTTAWELTSAQDGPRLVTAYVEG